MIRDLFLNTTIIITFVTLGNLFIKNKELVSDKLSVNLKIRIGIFFGLLGCVLMNFSIQVTETTIVDLRHVPIIISAVYFGFLPTVLSASLMSIYRTVFLGASLSSLVATILAMTTGIGSAYLAHKISDCVKRWTIITLFSQIIHSIGFNVLVQDKPLLIKLLIVYWISTLIVVIAIKSYSEYLITTNELFRKYKMQATKDFLTGLNNVRQFDSFFNQIVNEVKRKDKTVSLLFVDIDYFKKVNDTYGHAIGDHVLKELGEILKNNSRSFDIVSRNGGEEFSVILPECTSGEAVRMAERIRKTVQEHSFIIHNEEILHITVSIGVANYPETILDLNDLIRQSDEALYQAKQNGRNQVVLATKLESKE